MFVLGTAGHIDHGKSALVKALTGIDPDRLPEEKDRGMTIDLGFAHLRLPGGQEIGLIDVPGHERFVRNMVAGAGGINAVMLVVAADDGWMPQTAEHFAILNLLDIKYGLVALTKIDLVDSDWRELVKADIKNRLQGSFVGDTPIIPVSAVTGEGMPDLVAALDTMASHMSAVADIGKPRLFIDRVFVMTGAGVVVTGTSRGGGFAADTEVHHFPSGEKLKIRSLQSHDQKVDQVGAGYRVAMNLGGIDRANITRGHTILGFPYDARPTCFAVNIRNLSDSHIKLEEGRKVLLIIGTTETEAILRPFDDRGIRPGQDGLVVIKTFEPVAGFIYDRFIVRLPTPQITVGGGMILDILDSYPRRKELPDYTEYLTARMSKDPRRLITTELAKRLFTPLADFMIPSDLSQVMIDATIEELIQAGQIVLFEDHAAIIGRIAGYLAPIRKELEKVHRHKSYLKGLTAEELCRAIDLPLDDNAARLLRFYEKKGDLGRSQQFYHLPGFVPKLDDAMRREAESLMRAIVQAGHNYLTIDEIQSKFSGSGNTLGFLRSEKKLVLIGNQYVLTSDIWAEILAFIDNKLADPGKLSVAEFRDRFGSSRKYALAVLEYLDSRNITRRDGDFRVKGSRFDERHTL
jgi:selenocysteine-specific elongation factor